MRIPFLFFEVTLKTDSVGRRLQYSGPARRAALSWLGQENKTPRYLPGWSTSTYIGLEADMPKRDAVVEAFRVRPPRSPSSNAVCDMRQ